MEPDSTSNLANNINAPFQIDKYNTKLVHDLQEKIQQLERKNAELTLENVQFQVKKNVYQHGSMDECANDRNLETRTKIGTIKHLQQDIASMNEELETLKRLVIAKENRISLLEEEKRISVYQMEKANVCLKQELQMQHMALCEVHQQNQQLNKRVCQTQVELSQCRMQLSNLEQQHNLVIKLNREKDQALMLVGVWQDKCKAQESRADRLEARLRVLATVETDEDE